MTRAMKEHVFRDPVHGDIPVRDPTILALINAPELQRLRRIRQLGASFVSYPGAEHTRFAHSLGVYHLMDRALDQLAGRAGLRLTPEERVLGLAAALLHDAGHGPFSHLFERLTGQRHEAWTERILACPETRVHQVLRERDPAWPAAAAGLLAGRSGPAVVRELLSSQLDVDRMDYLLRDSLMCGVSYGRFDVDRLLSCLTVAATPEGPRLAVTAKGQGAAESFILARYFMYWNVYFHKATRSAEVLLEAILARAMDRAGKGRAHPAASPALEALLEGRPLSLPEFLSLDDTDVLGAVKAWAAGPDPVLADLSRRLLERRLFKALPLRDHPDPDQLDAIRARVAALGFPAPEYYVRVDRAENVAYSYYLNPTAGGAQPIRILAEEQGRVRVEEISRRSAVLQGITERPLTRYVLFVPAEARESVLPLVERQLLFDL